MPRRARRLVSALLAGWTLPSSLPAQRPASIGELLSPGTVLAEVLQVVAHPEYARLAQKFRAAVQANQEWFIEYLAKNDPAPGQALPYHPNFGITEAEYNYFLTLADSASVAVTASVELTLETVPDGVKFSVPDLPTLDGVRVHFVAGTVQTSTGTLATVEETHVDASVVGAWDGWRWSRSEGNPMMGDAVEESVSIGRLRDSGATLILHRYRQAATRQLTDRSDLIVRLPVRHEVPSNEGLLQTGAVPGVALTRVAGS